MPGANYTVKLDGVTRVNHDVRETAIEMGKLLKSKNLSSDVKVRRIDDGSLVADIIVGKSNAIGVKLPN